MGASGFDAASGHRAALPTYPVPESGVLVVGTCGSDAASGHRAALFWMWGRAAPVVPVATGLGCPIAQVWHICGGGRGDWQGAVGRWAVLVARWPCRAGGDVGLKMFLGEYDVATASWTLSWW